MIVRKSQQVLITVEMTEEQSGNLRSALSKVSEFPTPSDPEKTLSKEEVEVMNDLRQSLLNL
ncbi:hypothetical protein LCGC14_2460560 [marine sediment metagenome]|uniref:Uncharacterized protein n=1 Tax=marine sediment metagenome TaxID=412755 RepID=A0A0F9BE00_9ZZZZ